MTKKHPKYGTTLVTSGDYRGETILTPGEGTHPMGSREKIALFNMISDALIILMLLFYIFCSRRWLSLPVVLAFMLWWGTGSGSYNLFGVQFSTQAFAICALPLIYVQTNTGIRLPKWLFYAFYPVHLALIYALNTFVF